MSNKRFSVQVAINFEAFSKAKSNKGAHSCNCRTTQPTNELVNETTGSVVRKAFTQNQSSKKGKNTTKNPYFL